MSQVRLQPVNQIHKIETIEKITALIDVNVLIALFDPLHVHHEIVGAWFATQDCRIATCALTELGFVRICSHPRYANPIDNPEQALTLLRALHRNDRHIFWSETLSLAGAFFEAYPFQSHRETTDRYLLQLAAQQNGMFVTLDSRIRPADALERAALFLLKPTI